MEDVQDTPNPDIISKNNSDKEPDVAFSANIHENAALEYTSTSAHVGVLNIPLHTRTVKPQQGGFPIPKSRKTFPEENISYSLIDLSRSKAVGRKKVALRTPNGSSNKKIKTITT